MCQPSTLLRDSCSPTPNRPTKSHRVSQWPNLSSKRDRYEAFPPKRQAHPHRDERCLGAPECSVHRKRRSLTRKSNGPRNPPWPELGVTSNLNTDREWREGSRMKSSRLMPRPPLWMILASITFLLVIWTAVRLVIEIGRLNNP
jgi:hypothetical protein